MTRRVRVATPLHGIYGQPTFFQMTTRGQPAGARAPEPTDSFRLLVEGVRDYAIFMLDGAGRVLSWNTGAQRMKGYRADEIVGKHFSCFYPPEAVEAGKPARLLALAARDGRVEDEGGRGGHGGSRFRADVTITAAPPPHRAPNRFRQVKRDQT